MHADPQGSDRRQHPRLPIDAEIELRTSSAAHAARVLDLSLGGARVHAAQPIGEWGDAVEVRLPNQPPIPCTIVRVQPDATGVFLGLRFDALADAARAALARLITR